MTLKVVAPAEFLSTHVADVGLLMGAAVAPGQLLVRTYEERSQTLTSAPMRCRMSCRMRTREYHLGQRPHHESM